MSIAITCPRCQTKAKAPDNAAGKKVRCPNCRKTLIAPTAAKPAVPSIKFSCPSCLEDLEQPRAAAGTQVACSGCGQKLYVPQPATEAIKPAAPKRPSVPPVVPPIVSPPQQTKPATVAPVVAAAIQPAQPRRAAPAQTAAAPTPLEPAEDAGVASVGRAALRIVPAIILGLILIGATVRDAVSDLAKKVNVVVQDDSDKNGEPIFAVQVEEEPDEQIEATTPVVYHLVEDAPPERTGNAKPPPVKVKIEDEPDVGKPGKTKKGKRLPIHPAPIIRYNYNRNGRYGMTALFDRAGRALNKRITFSNDGSTSNTRIRVDGRDMDYGSGGGRWLERGKVLGNDPAAESFQRTISTYVVNDMHISQILEIIPSQQPVPIGGQQKRLLDTVLVRYIVENKGPLPHRFGLRSHVDTLIGRNDGVPFTVPGAGLITTSADYNVAARVPAFLQALENANLRSPGTVAHMTFKVGGGLEPPNRVSLTRWPGGSAPYFVRVTRMGSDSAVIIYWPELVMQPGQQRSMGFAYGLGSVDADQGGGRLGFTVAGSFEPGQSFSVTAYINNPKNGQTATLEVPDGLQVTGNATVSVPPATGGRATSIVTWQTKVIKTGKFRILVKTSDGLAQAKSITIVRPEIPAGGDVALDVKGEFEPGKSFTVDATVSEPQPGQILILKLPAGLSLLQGEPGRKVPPSVGGKSRVSWSVKVEKAGRFPVKVESSTGVTHTKTLTIIQPEEGAGRFTMGLTGEFAVGKVFTVYAKVENPLPQQTLRLQLPGGLMRVNGPETVTVKPLPDPRDPVNVQWNVKVTATGRHSVRVASSTGVIRKKTLTIGDVDPSKGRFEVALTGNIKPGKVFTVSANVTAPVPGQKLTLIVPRQLEVVDGPLTQPVALAPGPTVARIDWQVRVNDVGKLPVRVQSTTGIIRTKTIILRRKSSKGGLFGGS